MNINQLLSLLSINVIGSFVLFLVLLIQWIRQRNKKSTSSDITILEAEGGRVKTDPDLERQRDSPIIYCISNCNSFLWEIKGRTF